ENNPSALGLGRLYNAANQSTVPITVTTDSTTGLGSFVGVKIAGSLLTLGAGGTPYTLRAASGTVFVISNGFTVTGL
ncbi:MAG: hypothetical protein JWR01_2297, partial [Subtercola sp.]|nr:hypothetical protein [Subtercola sp.]